MIDTQNIEQKDNQIADDIHQRFSLAKNRRGIWENHWRDCYDYALPQFGHDQKSSMNGEPRNQKLFDGTAMDAVDQLAASLLGNLTPPWTSWFGFKPGPDLSEEQAEKISPVLEKITKKIQSHFDRSNFSVEMHQCFLDLAVGGTATLLFEETKPGGFSAFKFSAVPLQDIYLEEGENGFLDGSFRTLDLTLSQLQSRYANADLPSHILREGQKDPQSRFSVMESILPKDGVYHFTAILMADNQKQILKTGIFHKSPAISFRWMKSPGEIYGRSPVMKALPDIKTANKVVELILKNASIAVSGIWQADDDGVLNPANIELVPGAIIPKAVGSQGLRPLEMPSRFDISELVLKDLRGRIRHALLADRLGQVSDPKMTATEVLERSTQMAMLLGATYGRLQTELLTPLIQRAFAILKRRGEIPDIDLDGRTVMLDYRSPLAKAQAQRGVKNTLMWLDTVGAMGAQASMHVDTLKAVQHLGETLGVPSDLIKSATIPPLTLSADMMDDISGLDIDLTNTPSNPNGEI